MSANTDSNIQSAEVVLPGDPFDATVDFFTQRLGFRIDEIAPAESPSVASISGFGQRIRLASGNWISSPPAELRLVCKDPKAIADGEISLTAPNGVRINLVACDGQTPIPAIEPEFVITRYSEQGWGQGRAGMMYRDLIPSRLAGGLIASHIRIPVGGPVPDYVHYHRVRFQMIFCRAGWVEVVYENQGDPFVMQAGDCVLQPPEIRHRVLRASDGLEVIEISAPAVHTTVVDHGTELPSKRLDRHRRYGGQSFVRHIAASSTWRNQPSVGLQCRDLGIFEATGGVASAEVSRALGTFRFVPASPFGFSFLFLLEGTAELHHPTVGDETLSPGDACVIPADAGWILSGEGQKIEFLNVSVRTS